MRTNEPLDDFHRHDAMQADELSRCPICAYCGEHIQEDYCYETDDGDCCEECMDKKIEQWKDEHCKSIED